MQHYPFLSFSNREFLINFRQQIWIRGVVINGFFMGMLGDLISERLGCRI